MNIDFHYGVIFILARTAGLTRDEAQTVAHACQYVDDATTDGLLKFHDGQRFERFASAHDMIDYRNRVSMDNRESWVPFHFVPGGVESRSRTGWSVVRTVRLPKRWSVTRLRGANRTMRYTASA